ncbi:hypothetical protein A3Q56_08428 [Intoshia linei]|uniref:Uncharacterized protein n=1 Tax=Intoshia linei TaxID=1819745 RepID=A0A177APA8_9BILA|nr:hypothetical protein A3Q56_08428 [Intoshia linei]
MVRVVQYDEITNILEEFNLNDQIAMNADESTVFYNKSPKFTLAHASEKSIPGYKSAKDRLLNIIIISWEERSMDVDDSELMNNS